MGSPLHSQPPWMSTLRTSKPFNPPNNLLVASPFKTLIRLSSSSNASDANDSSSPVSEQNQDDSKSDRVSLAFNKALEYKKSLRLNDVQKIGVVQAQYLSRDGGIRDSKSGDIGFGLVDGELQQKTVSEFAESDKSQGNSEDEVQESAGAEDGKDEIPEAVRVAMEKAKEYKTNKDAISSIQSSGINEKLPGAEDGKDEIPEAVRVAMEKAKEYKKNKETISSIQSSGMDEKFPGDENGSNEVSEALRIAMEKAKEYKKNKGIVSSSGKSEGSEKLPGPSNGNTNDGANGTMKDKSGKKELSISKIDFLGLDFSDKKQRRGLPAGLVPAPDPFMGKELPEVEIIVGDASKFGDSPSSEVQTTQEDASDLYKPKVSTWGVFPRPNNISKTFGGGRNIRPGQALETEEEKAAKEARTKQLIAAYRAQTGLDVNPKLKAECVKALKDGDELMEVGKLKDALPYYQQVMEKMPFQSELHGLAALQWAICQDSLSRSDEAQGMYKKLKSHPNALVGKKARQFAFGFEAMEMMKVRRSAPRNPGYQTYFDAFVEDNPKYTSQDKDPEEGALTEALPYIAFLFLPVLIVLLIAAKHGI